MSKKALITGITGQDGSYLAEYLLDKGYEVHGMIRRCSTFSTDRIDHILNDITLHFGDLSDEISIRNLMHTIQPDELYNLAAQSHVKVSFEVPKYTTDSIVYGVLNVLSAVKDIKPDCRVYQASSSEMFGAALPMQSEQTIFLPQSPYACSKVFAHHLCRNYRESYGMFISCGILFNHESPRRGNTFVTKKITQAAAKIKTGKQKVLRLGNLSAKRDWGFAPEYVEAMHVMLSSDQPDDYVVATGETHSVQEFVEKVFEMAGLKWEDHVIIDQKYFRPSEVNTLCGDASKIKSVLGWQPKVRFDSLCEIMYKQDYDAEKEC